MTPNTSPMHFDQPIRIPKWGLVAIAACCAAIYLHLNLAAEKYSHLAISLTFLAAAGSTLSDKKSQLRLNSTLISIVLGIVGLGLLLFKSLGTPGTIFVGFFPLFAFFALVLLASSWQGLSQYRQEFIIFFFLGLPRLALAIIPNLLAPVTALLSTGLLWYTGWDVELRANNHIIVPNGGVQVVPSCSGLNLMLYMLGVSVLFLVLFPTSLRQKFVLPPVAMGLGFFVNGIRVALLALLSTAGNEASFEYWHSQEGALVFVCVAVILFGGLCFFLIKPAQTEITQTDIAQTDIAQTDIAQTEITQTDTDQAEITQAHPELSSFSLTPSKETDL